MEQRTLSVLSAVSIVALSFGCAKSKALTPTTPTPTVVTPSGGATLKITAPTPQSPINNVRVETFTLPALTASTASPTEGGNITPQYHFQLFDDTGKQVAEGLQNSPNWTPLVSPEFDKTYTWWVRAEFEGDAGPWSAKASFLSPNGGYIRGQEIFDPLTNGRTVGRQIGGHFIAGQGWMADALTNAIDYLIPSCGNCTVEFDVTNFGHGEGEPFAKDVKWISMGDASAFDDFLTHRNHPWKMHLEQRADGDGTGMKLIWRNGDVGDGEPGDHTAKIDPAVDWRGDVVYHFTLTWNPGGFEIFIGETQPNGSVINNKRWFADGFGGNAYAPPNHIISLGTRSREETMINAIWRNIKVYPGGRR
jgi:hypothetical protein